VSIPSNIAEGHGRKFTKAYINHLSIAFGSLMEVETLVLIAAQRKFLHQDSVADLLSRADEIGKMLSGLQKSLKTRSDDPA
jgi:four helix bundle protein